MWAGAKRRAAPAPAAIAPDHWRTPCQDMKFQRKAAKNRSHLALYFPKPKYSWVERSEVHHCFKTYNYSLNKMLQKVGKKKKEKKENFWYAKTCFPLFLISHWKTQQHDQFCKNVFLTTVSCMQTNTRIMPVPGRMSVSGFFKYWNTSVYCFSFFLSP